MRMESSGAAPPVPVASGSANAEREGDGSIRSTIGAGGGVPNRLSFVNRTLVLSGGVGHDGWVYPLETGLSLETRRKITKSALWCEICGKVFREGEKRNVDHIFATCRGGSDDRSNLQVVCARCNSRKAGVEVGVLLREVLAGRAVSLFDLPRRSRLLVVYLGIPVS